MVWSEKVIDLAGDNFDVLGCHNYEYEPENFETGLRRIRDYLTKLRDYVRASKHPEYRDRRPRVEPTAHLRLARGTACRRQPHALRGTQPQPDDDLPCPAHAKHDGRSHLDILHLSRPRLVVSRVRSYVVEKLFREHYAERYLASATGAFHDLPDRKHLFDQISTIKPEEWLPGSVDAIATASADGRRIVIKAVNYRAGAQHSACATPGRRRSGEG